MVFVSYGFVLVQVQVQVQVPVPVPVASPSTGNCQLPVKSNNTADIKKHRGFIEKFSCPSGSSSMLFRTFVFSPRLSRDSPVPGYNAPSIKSTIQ
jgi:hypothetical protein